MASSSSADAEEPAGLLRLLTDPKTELHTLLGLWRARVGGADFWSRVPEPYQVLADRALKLGQFLVAYDVATAGLEHSPQDVRLRQLQGLALARVGLTERANQIIEDLHRHGHGDEETLGILAHTHKELSALAQEPAEQTAHLRRAADVYDAAYRQSGGYWTGINAATMAMLLGQKERATVLARHVREQCLQELKRLQERGADAYWAQATLGEAALLLGQWSEAETWYAKAADSGRGRFGDLNSTRRNARLLLARLAHDGEAIEQCMRIPRVVVFSGHMIDRPDRPVPRFPPQLEPVVYDAIRDRLQKVDGSVGYASAASASDILFLEAILERNGEAHVVLPYEHEQFVEDSVDVLPGADWEGRYARALNRATEVIMASDQKPANRELSFDYANLMLLGLASIRAAQLETELVPLAVWDAARGDGPGGTASAVERWMSLGHQVELIDLAELLGRQSPRLKRHRDKAKPGAPIRLTGPAAEFDTRIVAMLFADVVKFSTLTDEQIPRFVRHFLGAVADLMAMSPHAPLMRETWGDGLYFVFGSVRHAGEFALALSERVASTNWEEKGLPPQLRLRISLHAGPVYACTDPITGLPKYIGRHVSRAARLEPITPPGQVYASAAFAALAAADQVSTFTCDYVGQTPLAKSYGTLPTYYVRRRSRPP